MTIHEIDVGLGGGSLLQVANRSPVQMMSYVIDTPEGKTILIDGGYRRPEDAAHLRELIRERGDRVDLWLFSHGHDDHYGALLWLLEHTDSWNVEIGRLCFDFPPAEWFQSVEGGVYHAALCALLEQLERHGIPYEPLTRGQILACGGMTVEVIKDSTGYEKYHSINDSSVILRAHFPKRDVLFLGDLAANSGRDFLEVCDHAQLRCDIVQMAHHGQGGVDRAFYEVVQPKLCLYTAPDWLWDNNSGGGKGSGPWATLKTRQWMEDLGVEYSCPCAMGDYLLK